jgi:hypothetical protein
VDGVGGASEGDDSLGEVCGVGWVGGLWGEKKEDVCGVQCGVWGVWCVVWGVWCGWARRRRRENEGLGEIMEGVDGEERV